MLSAIAQAYDPEVMLCYLPFGISQLPNIVLSYVLSVMTGEYHLKSAMGQMPYKAPRAFHLGSLVYYDLSTLAATTALCWRQNIGYVIDGIEDIDGIEGATVVEFCEAGGMMKP